MSNSLVNFSQQDTDILVSNIVLKLLVFPVGSLYFALPVDYVNKVIKKDKVYSSGLNSMGMIHLEDREITIIDLHRKIYLTSEQTDKNNYFVLTQNNRGEQFGILTTTTPSIFDISLAQIRQLPNSYRQSDTLGIASHVTTIDKQELLEKNTIQDYSNEKEKGRSPNDDLESEMATIFLLDIDRLLG
jgi:chemotaxis signal transduction protein